MNEITITIKRTRLSNYRHQPLRWTYSYTTPVDIEWPHYRDGKPDGTSHPGPRAGQYVEHGTSVVELRAMLRRRFGKDITIIETWKQAKS